LLFVLAFERTGFSIQNVNLLLVSSHKDIMILLACVSRQNLCMPAAWRIKLLVTMRLLLVRGMSWTIRTQWMPPADIWNLPLSHQGKLSFDAAFVWVDSHTLGESKTVPAGFARQLKEDQPQRQHELEQLIGYTMTTSSAFIGWYSCCCLPHVDFTFAFHPLNFSWRLSFKMEGWGGAYLPWQALAFAAASAAAIDLASALLVWSLLHIDMTLACIKSSVMVFASVS